MSKEELNEKLKTYELEIDMIDEMGGTTIEDKRKFKIEEIIENEVVCPNCKSLRLTGCSCNGDTFLCEKCGNLFSNDDLIK